MRVVARPTALPTGFIFCSVERQVPCTMARKPPEPCPTLSWCPSWSGGGAYRTGSKTWWRCQKTWWPQRANPRLWTCSANRPAGRRSLFQFLPRDLPSQSIHRPSRPASLLEQDSHLGGNRRSGSLESPLRQTLATPENTLFYAERQIGPMANHPDISRLLHGLSRAAGFDVCVTG